FSIAVAPAQRPAVLLLAVLFALLLSVLARLNPRRLFVRLLMVNFFVAFLWLFLPFTCAGEELWSIGPLRASRQGVHEALTITVKSNAIILATIALLGTSRIFSLVHALRHLYVPDKLVHLFFFCFRYIHVLQQEYLRLAQAAKIRNFRPGTSLHAYRTFAYLAGMLLVNSYDRSQRIYQAMLCRGFQGKYPVLHHFESHATDALAMAAMILFIVFLGLLQWKILL
ncbi:MAG: cobalt ECF transporter T component CbiQ, partial [Deltaproteobacteria bacterium]|nr:cobalt ECF transporter T component CbiQ [Deltaproteobacteria bacterium]